MTKKQEKRRPASYFIDYENVRGAGLDGVEALQKGDEVVVLYGSKDSALKLGAVQNVLDSPAKVRFVKVATGKHDALDFQLVALMFMKMKKKRDYYIVSRDTGFDFAIRMAKERGFDRVYRRETISGATLEQKKLPSPKRTTRTKRLPQPKDAAPAAAPVAAAGAEAPAQEPAAQPEAKEQPAKRPRRRGGRRNKRQDAAQVPEQVRDQASEPEPEPQPAPEPKPAIEAVQRDVAPEPPVAPEPVKEEPPAVEAEPAPAEEPVPAEEPAPVEAPAEAAPAKKPRRRPRRAKQDAAPPADPYRAQVEEVLAKQLGAAPEAKKVDVVLAALESCETKARFYNYLRGNLGNEQGVAFYREVKGCFDQLKAIER